LATGIEKPFGARDYCPEFGAKELVPKIDSVELPEKSG